MRNARPSSRTSRADRASGKKKPPDEVPFLLVDPAQMGPVRCLALERPAPMLVVIVQKTRRQKGPRYPIGHA